MTLESKRLAAVFFIPAKAEQGSIVDILQKGCATQILISKDSIEMADCVWATWSCKGYISSSPNYQLLCIYFWQSDFLESLDDNRVKPIEQDGLFFLFKAFECACDSLLPELGFIATHTWQSDLDFIQEREQLLINYNIDALLKEYFGLTYLSKEVAEGVSIDSQNREVVRTSSGLMIFAGKEDSRWF